MGICEGEAYYLNFLLVAEVPGAGRAKLRLSRGLPFGFVRQRHPLEFLLGLFDHFVPREQDLLIFASRIFRLGNGDAYRDRSKPTDLRG
jgi:hypothetical protein